MKAFLCAAVLGLLTGCQPALQQLSGTTASEQIILTREDFAEPVMRVQIPSRGANAVLSRVAVNKDVETWLAVDNISLSFQKGVLVASRGLGFDLMGADAQNTLKAIAGGGDKIYRRQMRYLTGDHHSTYLTAGCSLKPLGAETVGGQRLHRIEERCEARPSEFTNIFWLNSSGTIVQSQQWVSPSVGYIQSSIGRR